MWWRLATQCRHVDLAPNRAAGRKRRADREPNVPTARAESRRSRLAVDARGRSAARGVRFRPGRHDRRPCVPLDRNLFARIIINLDQLDRDTPLHARTHARSGWLTCTAAHNQAAACRQPRRNRSTSRARASCSVPFRFACTHDTTRERKKAGSAMSSGRTDQH